KGYNLTVSASVDGRQWETLDELKGNDYWGELPAPRAFRGVTPPSTKKNPSPVVFMYDYTEPDGPAPEMKNYWGNGAPGKPVNITYTAKLNHTNYRYFKVEGDMPSAMSWSFGAWDFYKGEEFQCMLPSLQFNSTWKSAGNAEEWVYVDFGAPAKFDKVKLHWVNKAVAGKVQVSDDASAWTEVAALPGGDNRVDEIALKKEAKGRYVRVLCQQSANGKGYELSEMQVFGKGGLVAEPLPQAKAEERKLVLNGGNWKLQRASEVKENGEQISAEGFNTQDWIWATVPGTILSSFRNIAALPDPNFADNQLQISDSYFLSDFWYQNEFEVADLGEKTFLNFDGINWKADVFLNGKSVGRIEGAFMKGKFDVTPLVKKGKNILAVKIIRNAHPGAIKEQTAFSADANGGILGADNATFHASIGWDWIPTIRGRNIGIWNDVYLTYTGAVTIEDPFIRAELPLPDTSSADLFAEVTLRNHEAKAVKGVLKGKYGDAAFEQEVSLEANEEKVVKLDPTNAPALHLENPHLWWPKGYGEPYLYDVELAFETEGKVSDLTRFKSGVRQMTFDESEYLPSGGIQFSSFGNAVPKRLSLYINGRRFVGFGGNWG
ncbi:MAG: discoidin domain-containing protein, partial [Bacteroidaceae bacterium]|nr:discoidin domain-containing protein [Bacteroidaceae bacterium]